MPNDPELTEYIERFPEEVERELRLGRLDFPKATSLADSAFYYADWLTKNVSDTELRRRRDGRLPF